MLIFIDDSVINLDNVIIIGKSQADNLAMLACRGEREPRLLNVDYDKVVAEIARLSANSSTGAKNEYVYSDFDAYWNINLDLKLHPKEIAEKAFYHARLRY